MKDLVGLKVLVINILAAFILFTGCTPPPQPGEPCPECPPNELIDINLTWDPIEFFADISWDPSESTDVLGYRVYYGNASRQYNTTIDVGDTLGYKAKNLTTDKNWYFAVTAYDTALNESQFSNEDSLIFNVDDPEEPPADSIITYLPKDMLREGYDLLEEGGQPHEVARLPDNLNIGKLSFTAIANADSIGILVLDDSDGHDDFDVYINGFNINSFSPQLSNNEWRLFIFPAQIAEDDDIEIVGTKANDGTRARISTVITK